jgi:exopolysaccharide production protein ExoZ
MKPKTTLHSLQALRAVAAWLVIADHALLEITHNEPGNSLTHIAWTLGSTGVCVFFVISGFIMVHISWESFGRPAAAADFLRRRINRIVPLYWLATIVALAYHRVSATHGAHAEWSELVQCLVFIPHASEDGSWNPHLPGGWTLNYEMMFYVVFALGLSFSRYVALPAIALALASFVIAGPLIPNESVAYLASPIVLWFVLGMGLAVLWRWQRLEEPKWLAKSTKFLEPLGNASYSTYLSHGFVLTMLLRAWTMVAGPPSLLIVPVSLVVATAGGWMVHMFVERPILRMATSLGRPRREIVRKVQT